MNILMFTNTFIPHVGGVAHSVAWLAADLRSQGHSVLVIAPEYADAMKDEPDVLRVPAVQHFRGSEFSLPIPFMRSLDAALDAFAPDIVHSHHPFLLGGSALRAAASRGIPIVYTCHTRYDLYEHYIVSDVPALQRLALSLTVGYCNLCSAVIAPSRSTGLHLAEHGVERPVSVIPTGIDLAFFAKGTAGRARAVARIPDGAFVVGHVGRLATEKNLAFLSEAVSRFLVTRNDAHFLVAGQGEMMPAIQERFDRAGVADRLHLVGMVEGNRLADTYAAMDVFAFSSLSETQGLVLAEAMAAGVPVVALDAAGAREIVNDGMNGRLLNTDATPREFAEALDWIGSGLRARRLRVAARLSAVPFSRERTTRSTAMLYMSLLAARPVRMVIEGSSWNAAVRRAGEEWKIFRNIAHAVGDAVLAPELAETLR
jgi:glycosyltransferase involved in cell wall biosynthesis